MSNQFLTNYTETSFLTKIRENLRHCKSFFFSVSFIKKAGLILLKKDIESLKFFFSLMSRYQNFTCHLDFECFHDAGYATLGYHSKGYLFTLDESCELIVGSSNITRYALFKNI